MSESGRARRASGARKSAQYRVVFTVARHLHVLLFVAIGAQTFISSGCSGCVVPPHLDIQSNDAGPDSPPVIVEVRDTALNPRRPPDTITVNAAVPSTLGMTLYDTDLTDTLTVQIFVDYDQASPKDAVSNCFGETVTSTPTTRTASCTTAALCAASDAGTTHRLEIEVYDRDPEPNAPFRDPTPPGMYSTWTFDLACVNQPG